MVGATRPRWTRSSAKATRSLRKPTDNPAVAPAPSTTDSGSTPGSMNTAGTDQATLAPPARSPVGSSSGDERGPAAPEGRLTVATPGSPNTGGTVANRRLGPP